MTPMQTPDVINLLEQENPVVANLLIDYFGLHKQSKFHCNANLAFVGSSGTVWYPPDNSLRIHLRTRTVKLVCLHNLHIDKL